MCFIVSFSFIASGCSGPVSTPQDHASAGNANTGPAKEETIDTPSMQRVPAEEKVVTIPVDGDHEAIFLGPGDEIRYEIPASPAGALSGLAIQIGNFDGSSEGALMLRACQGSVCSEGTADLVGSVDNDYLAVRFQTPLLITDGPLDVTVARTAGQNPFAVWAYPAVASMALPDGRDVRKNLKTQLYFQAL